MVRQALESKQQMSREGAILDCLLRIYDAEIEGEIIDTVFDYSKKVDVLVEHYNKTKLMLRRLEFDLEGEDEFYKYCDKTKVSQYFIAQILLHNLLNARKVCRKLITEYSRKEGANCEKVLYFQALYEQLEVIKDE